jgi:hypothetical protein
LAIPGTALLLRGGRGDKRGREQWTLGLLSVVLSLGYAYFTASFSYQSWGWTTGPRHLTGLIPFLLLPIALFLDNARRGSTENSSVALGIGAGLCAASIGVTGLLTFVNYIPDSVSNALFGFAIPLFKDGYFPPSLWVFGSLPNPWAGYLLVVLLGVAAVVAAALLCSGAAPPFGGAVQARGTSPSTILAAGATAALFFALLAVVPIHPERDPGAVRHLKSVWLAPPNQSLDFNLD